MSTTCRVSRGSYRPPRPDRAPRCRTAAPRARARSADEKPITRGAPDNRASIADLISPCRSIATSYCDRRSSRIARQQRGAAGSAPPRSLIDQPPIDHRHQIEDLAMLGADQPVDPRGRKRAAQRGGHRDGVHDVAQGAEAHDQEALSRLAVARSVEVVVVVRVGIRASRSRVAWLLGSPTIAVRPPYAGDDAALRHGVDGVVGAFAMDVGVQQQSSRSTVASPKTTT